MHRLNQGEGSNRARRDQRDVGSSVADPWRFRDWRPLGGSRKPGVFQIGKGQGQQELKKAERRKRSIPVLLAEARLEGSRSSRLKPFVS
ncbi:unnamed protein product [Symbiodinium sp. CCMP2456]|nr:unnamed protein product [Symbiodinium sp. CCMP2456]